MWIVISLGSLFAARLGFLAWVLIKAVAERKRSDLAYREAVGKWRGCWTDPVSLSALLAILDRNPQLVLTSVDGEPLYAKAMRALESHPDDSRLGDFALQVGRIDRGQRYPNEHAGLDGHQARPQDISERIPQGWANGRAAI